jgi:ligand-binding sensor domain-containing protein
MARRISILLIALLLVSCDKEVFTDLVESSVTTFGKVFISTNPKGYKLYIDNKYMNLVTPDSIPYISEGPHSLILKSDLFSDSTLNIEVNKSKPVSLSIDMMKNPRFFAKVLCSSNPQGAKIFLNDQPTSFTTPATLTNIYPGNVEVKFLKNQYWDDSVVVRIKGGESTNIYRILEDTSRTVSYRTSNSKISSNVISKVVIDKNNNKWIGSIDHGLMKFDGKKWTSYENAGVINGTRVQDLLIDKRGRLWVGTANGLTVFDGLNWQSYTDKLPSSNVSALEEDVNGNIWIATTDGLVKYNNSSFQTFDRSNTNMPLFNLTALSSAQNGDIWIGTSSSGIIRYRNGNWNLFVTGSRPGLDGVSNIIQDLIVDKNGNLWTFHSENKFEGVAASLTFMSSSGLVWIFKQLPILFTLEINSFYLDSAGNIWMSVNGGLLKYSDTEPLKVYDPDTNGFFSKQCTSFAIDQNGDGWLTTLGSGIAKLKKGTF